jgi:hypothetical protein
MPSAIQSVFQHLCWFLSKAEALQTVQDVVDRRKVHHRVDGVQDALPVELFLLRDKLVGREHGTDDESNVAIVHLQKGRSVVFFVQHSPKNVKMKTWWLRRKKLPPILYGCDSGRSRLGTTRCATCGMFMYAACELSLPGSP